MKKILIVDDEKQVCYMLEQFFIRKGYETFIALSGEEAIRKVKEEKPQLILLDIRMSEMDGIETLKKIKEIDKETCIVMITAVEDEETGQKCMELGAYDYVTKPFDFEHLETIVSIKLLGLGS